MKAKKQYDFTFDAVVLIGNSIFGYKILYLSIPKYKDESDIYECLKKNIKSYFKDHPTDNIEPQLFRIQPYECALMNNEEFYNDSELLQKYKDNRSN